MNHADVIKQSATNINELTNRFGTRELVFDRAAKIASILLNKEITPYEVSMITMALNFGHLQENRADSYSYVSAVTNLAFAAQFASIEKVKPTPLPEKELMDGLENIVKNFSVPNPQPNPNPSNVTMKDEPEA